MRAAMLVGLSLLAACAPAYPEREADQQQRQAIFKDCLDRIPEGPKQTRYNDWAEVVEACDGIAFQQSLVCVGNCPSLPHPTPSAAQQQGGAE